MQHIALKDREDNFDGKGTQGEEFKFEAESGEHSWDFERQDRKIDSKLSETIKTPTVNSATGYPAFKPHRFKGGILTANASQEENTKKLD